MKVAFHLNHLDLRGTGVAVYDYANHCERLLGHESVIVCPSTELQPRFQDEDASRRFEARFEVRRYDRFEQVDPLLRELEVDVFYAIKAGKRDRAVTKQCKSVVHAVFQHYDPHGDVYAYVSHWLSQKMSQGVQPWVPHMFDLPDLSGDLRERLEIPRDAIVFGRHGANETFDLPFVHRAVAKTARRRSDVFFLFLNTDRFCKQRPNIIHLPGTADLEEKVRFINTCDAMLHARKQGESFGLAVGEFSVRNRPVITFEGSKDRAHIEQLGDKGIYYRSKRELMRVLDRFEPDAARDWDAYSRDLSPRPVMERFAKVFLG